MSERLFPVFPDIYLPQLENVTLPEVFPVELQHQQTPALEEPGLRACEQLEKSKRLAQLKAGARVGIAVGSRGIRGLPEVVAALVKRLKESGYRPELIPAMGSHGGGDAKRQAQILRDLGLSEDAMGAQICSSMEVVKLGATSDGVPCYFSRDAVEMDAVIVVNRVKAHTSFERRIESGLTKMVAVGLGKAEGARYVHRLGPYGLRDVLPKLADIAIAEAPIAFGIAVVENADKSLVRLEGAEPEQFSQTDERLLVLAKQNLARLPFEQIDVLVVEQLGKDISGMGMDYAVIARTDIRGIANPPRPFIHKIVALTVTDASHGNAQGIGVADFVPQRVIRALDLKDMYVNSLTASVIEKARIPPVLPNDREAIRAAVATAWRLKEEDVRMCVIRSTLHLNNILVSRALRSEVEGLSGARITGQAKKLEFTDDGALVNTGCS